jgi:tRNA threonylcarbamoyladenosine modification (KEOPS) complex  Pcc1 subunit
VGNVIISSLRPELAAPTSDRSEVSIDLTTKGILIKIEAEDITALRAAANSYLYWVRAIIEISDKILEKNNLMNY